jgi:hypothetical protein
MVPPLTSGSLICNIEDVLVEYAPGGYFALTSAIRKVPTPRLRHAFACLKSAVIARCNATKPNALAAEEIPDNIVTHRAAAGSLA